MECYHYLQTAKLAVFDEGVCSNRVVDQMSFVNKCTYLNTFVIELYKGNEGPIVLKAVDSYSTDCYCLAI